MRGKGLIGEYEHMELRITPAYAGKRTCTCYLQPAKKDHPCVCGEKPQIALFFQPPQGSPLRMRGKVKKLPSIFE